MPTPFPSRKPALTCWSSASCPKGKPSDTDWRCTRCDKLLGICRDGRLHLRFAKGHEYFVALPAQATCRSCGTLNQASAPAR